MILTIWPSWSSRSCPINWIWSRIFKSLIKRDRLDNKNLFSEQLRIYKCWLKKWKDSILLTSKSISLKIFFLSILIINYKSNSFNLGDQNKLKMMNYCQNAAWHNKFFLLARNLSKLTPRKCFSVSLEKKFGSHSIPFKNGNEAKKKKKFQKGMMSRKNNNK